MERPDPQKSREHAAFFDLSRCIMSQLLGHQNSRIKRALTKIWCGVPHAAFFYGPN
jgi:hypothetical protein